MIAGPEPALSPYHLFCLGFHIGNKVLIAEMQAGVRLENGRIPVALAALHGLT
jgi:hypothetical protein